MSLRSIAVPAALAALCVPGLGMAQARHIVLQSQATASVSPDRGAFPVTIRVAGDNEAAVRAALEQQDASARTLLARYGIGAAQITVPPPGQGEVVREPDYRACDAMVTPAVAAPRAATDRVIDVVPSRPACTKQLVIARRTLVVEARGAAQEQALIELDSGDQISVSKPSYVQSDPAAARQKARDAAMAQARQDGDAMAAQMGYRIVGISRVSTADAPLSQSGLIRFLAEVDGPARKRGPEWYAGTATQTVTIDFIAVPK